jgi:hypothetical protein
MINALLLVFDPTATWERIFRSQRGVWYVLATHLSPLLIFTSIAEGYRLAHWSRPGLIRPLDPMPLREAIVFEACQFVLWMAVVVLGSALLWWMCQAFRSRNRRLTQAFLTVAYGLAPLFLLRFLDAVKGMSPWAGYAIGIVLSVAVLYHGVPRMMEPTPPQAFGLYVITATLLVLVSCVVRLATAWFLEGRFRAVEAMVSDLAGKLPF